MSKIKTKYKIYNGKNIKDALDNSRIYFLAIMFSAGLLIGAICIKNENLSIENLSAYINTYISVKSEQGIYSLFINSLISNAIFFLTTLFLSFSLIGYPLIIWIPFFKGLGIGAVCGYLYSVYKFSGFGFSMLTIFPGAIVSTYALLCACNKGCEYSKNAYLKVIPAKGQFEKNELKVFMIRQAFFVAVCGVSSLIDAIFSYVFLRFFEI